MNNDQVVDAHNQNRQLLVDEQELLERAIDALSTSRLNNGILFIPEGLTVEAKTVSLQYDDELEAELLDALKTPVADTFAASAFMPFLIRGPEELYGGIVYKAPNIYPDLEVLRNRVEFIKTRIEWLDEHRPGGV